MLSFRNKFKDILFRDVFITVLVILVTAPLLITSLRQKNNSFSGSFCRPSGVIHGTDELKVYVPKTSTYTIWTHIESPIQINYSEFPETYNPLLISVDNKACYPVEAGADMPLNTWVWIDNLNNSPTRSFTISIDKGIHYFYVTGSYSSIDRLELISNGCVPSGDGSNCIPKTPPAYLPT